MDIGMIIFTLVLIISMVGLIFWIKRGLLQNSTLLEQLQEQSQMAAQVPLLKEQIAELKATLQSESEASALRLKEMAETIATLQDEKSELIAQKATAQANFEAEIQSSQKLQQNFEQQSKQLQLKLNEIMQQSLEGKLKTFDETSMKSLETILKPFKENIESFKAEVKETQKSSIERFAKLSQEIEHLSKAGMHISQEAHNLANALKSKKQMQGSWGEMILESVLEYSGLLKGVHYETQVSYKDNSGDIKRPDVVIKLPQERTIIIDSKVSLNAYSEYVRADDKATKKLRALEVVKAFKEQIDNLHSKDYAHYKTGTLEYVFMFVPIEGAFSLAIESDPTLYEYALKRHIAIVTPATLTVSLHTIYLYWQSDQSSTLAIKLFEEAGRLYDKVCLFSETFVKVGDQLQTVSKSYDRALNQLSQGKGNILGRVENLKQLGARTTKQLSNEKIEFQSLDLDDMEVEIVDTTEVIENKQAKL